MEITNADHLMFRLENVEFEGVIYDVRFTTLRNPTDQPCSLCGQNNNVIEESMGSVFHEIVDAETMLAIEAGTEKGRLILEKAQKEVTRTICAKCLEEEMGCSLNFIRYVEGT